MTDYVNRQTAEGHAAAIDQQIEALADDAKALLVDLIKFESLGGREDEVQAFLASWLQQRQMPVELVPLDPELHSDRNYSPHSLDSHHAPNLLTELPFYGGGPSLLLNSHVDVVPAENPDMFTPKVENSRIIGRGAADAKGQVVCWILAMLAVKETGIKLKGRCVGAAVVEEEVGGNGTLAWARAGNPLDAAVVLEPTGMGIHPANRGAVWFKISTTGVPTHMGRWWEGQSAYENLEKILAAVREWDAELVSESRGVPLFPDDPSPVHVNIGIVRAGDWPSKVPSFADCEGGVGFLPNKKIEDIKQQMREVVERAALKNAIQAEVVFEKLQNDAYAIPADHPAVLSFSHASHNVRGQADVSGFLASCDARLLYHRAGMPTIVFGPGELLMAHSDIESISMDDIVTASKILGRFIIDWCKAA